MIFFTLALNKGLIEYKLHIYVGNSGKVSFIIYYVLVD